MNNVYDMLSPGVQYWVHRQGWPALRAVQAEAIPPILAGDRDILIMAPTAGGKTEAAFLPVISWIETHAPSSYGALIISPLKALINNQYQRLDLLCEAAGTQITPWHGDISQSKKNKSWKSPEGLLMITPESLEAMFVKRPLELKARLSEIGYIVIDEYHAFVGSVRGQQLLSLLSRVEALLGRSVPRIALSATIGNPQLCLDFLRPGKELPGAIINPAGPAPEIVVGVRLLQPREAAGESFVGLTAIDLYRRLRGKNNLVFANARSMVEGLTDKLERISEGRGVPNEFLPHHGSLSSEIRHHAEHRLQEGRLPTTALATSTLELGIDIGNVDSVGQVGAPANVSSLRQRLGRSGRRGTPAKLRIYIEGKGHGHRANGVDCLELELVQTAAVLNLMFAGWLEPPVVGRLHSSTFVQQVLSMISYTGGVNALTIHRILVQKGPWSAMPKEHFFKLLKAMGDASLIGQQPTGELIIGEAGEQILSNYTFYAAFKTDEEYRLVANGRSIGQIPVSNLIVPGMLIVFGGKRWEVVSVENNPNVIKLKTSTGGSPIAFGGEAAPVHGKIREEMLNILRSDDDLGFLDKPGTRAIQSSRELFKELDIEVKPWVRSGDSVSWIVFDDDRVKGTLALALQHMGLRVFQSGSCITIETDFDEMTHLVRRLAVHLSGITSDDLIPMMPCIPLGKFDEPLSPSVQQWILANDLTDLFGAEQYLEKIIGRL